MKPIPIGLAALAVAGSVQADELKKLPNSLNPAKAYVIVELGKLDDESIVPATLTLARYDTETKDIAIVPPKNAKAKTIQLAHFTLVKQIVKEKDRRLALAEMEPGLWVIEGANDTAFSLGSSTMQLAAGSVTDLGVASVYTDFAEGEKRDVLTNSRLLKGALMGGLLGRAVPKPVQRAVDFRPRGSGDMQLPPLLAAKVAPVQWTAEVRFGNYLGGLINRMGGRKARPGAIPPQAAPPSGGPAPAPATVTP